MTPHQRQRLTVWCEIERSLVLLRATWRLHARIARLRSEGIAKGWTR